MRSRRSAIPDSITTSTCRPLDGLAGYASNNNNADMITANYKHKFGQNLTWYTDVAATINGYSAHYDLGAGGRAVTTDAHSAFGGDRRPAFGPASVDRHHPVRCLHRRSVEILS